MTSSPPTSRRQRRLRRGATRTINHETDVTTGSPPRHRRVSPPRVTAASPQVEGELERLAKETRLQAAEAAEKAQDFSRRERFLEQVRYTRYTRYTLYIPFPRGGAPAHASSSHRKPRVSAAPSAMPPLSRVGPCPAPVSAGTLSWSRRPIPRAHTSCLGPRGSPRRRPSRVQAIRSTPPFAQALQAAAATIDAVRQTESEVRLLEATAKATYRRLHDKEQLSFHDREEVADAAAG